MVAELKKLASSAAGKHAAYKKYTVQPTGIWKRIGDFFAVDPKRSSGIPPVSYTHLTLPTIYSV